MSAAVRMRRIFPLALSLVLLLLVAAGANGAGRQGRLIYCGRDAGKSYIPSFYVNPSLYGFDSNPVTTDISMCSNRSATAKVVLLAPRGVTFDLSSPPGTTIGRVSGKGRGRQAHARRAAPPRDDRRRRSGPLHRQPLRRVPARCCVAPADEHRRRQASLRPAGVRRHPEWRNHGPAAGLLQLGQAADHGLAGNGGLPAPEVVRRLERGLGAAGGAGGDVWHGFFTPFRTNGWPNPAATVEGRATQLLPILWTLNETYDAPSGAARVTGSLTQGGQPVAGLTFPLWHGAALGGGSFPGILNPTIELPRPRTLPGSSRPRSRSPRRPTSALPAARCSSTPAARVPRPRRRAASAPRRAVSRARARSSRWLSRDAPLVRGRG